MVFMTLVFEREFLIENAFVRLLPKISPCVAIISSMNLLDDGALPLHFSRYSIAHWLMLVIGSCQSKSLVFGLYRMVRLIGSSEFRRSKASSRYSDSPRPSMAMVVTAHPRNAEDPRIHSSRFICLDSSWGALRKW